jgi:hypothetical protein
MDESFQTRLMRLFFHIHPAYHGTGGHLLFIAADWSEIRLEIPLNWRTRNYVGTIFGGSIYGATDPMFMIMLIKRLGPEFIVWDKAATIQFLKPGKSSLYAKFIVPDVEVVFIKDELKTRYNLERVYPLEITDAEGVVCARVEKKIYIRIRKKVE